MPLSDSIFLATKSTACPSTSNTHIPAVPTQAKGYFLVADPPFRSSLQKILKLHARFQNFLLSFMPKDALILIGTP